MSGGAVARLALGALLALALALALLPPPPPPPPPHPQPLLAFGFALPSDAARASAALTQSASPPGLPGAGAEAGLAAPSAAAAISGCISRYFFTSASVILLGSLPAGAEAAALMAWNSGWLPEGGWGGREAKRGVEGEGG